MSSRTTRTPRRRTYVPRAAAVAPAPVMVVQAPAPKKKRSLFKKLGRGLASIARPIANAGIKKLQDMAIQKISGMGDYSGIINELKANSLIHPTMNDTVPAFSNISGGVQIAHREYITDILSSTDFLNRSFSINPAIPETFPWLSAIAVNFEQYHVRGMIFEFKSGSSDALNSTNTALGYVVMTTEYNSLASPYTNKNQMENSQFCVSTKPSKSVIHPIECAPFQTPSQPLYTRLASGTYVSEGDKRLYDLGNFQVATTGMQAANVNIGELWVSYVIDFYKPVLGTGLAFDAKNAHYNIHNIQDGMNMLGNPETVFDSIGGYVDGGEYNFPQNSVGKYLITYNVAGAASTNAYSTRDPLVPHGSVVVRSYWATAAGDGLGFNAAGIIPSGEATATQQTVFNWVIEIPLARVDNRFALTPASPSTYANFPNDETFGDLVIVQLNGSYH